MSSRPRAAQATHRYEGSNRYYRGRALAVLRQAPPEGVTLRELGERVREGFGDADLPWLRSVVESLGKDGLAEISADEERSAEPAQAHALVGLPEH